MGQVWAARDLRLHRDVALKFLILDGELHPDLPKRFEREAVAAAQINHPHVATVYDSGFHDDLCFIAMEKVDGRSLAEVIAGQAPMSPDDALRIAGEICEALVAAHAKGVIHYDIKPQNVMLTPDGRVKVVDFGIAGFQQTRNSLVGTTLLSPAGTVEYGSPEQFRGEGDARSDLYALGSVLFAMLSGGPPFAGTNAMAVLLDKHQHPAPRLDVPRPELPPALVSLVDELLQSDPGRRPRSAQDLHRRIRQLRAEPEPEPETDRPEDADGRERGTDSGPPHDHDTLIDETFTLTWKGAVPLETYVEKLPRRPFSQAFSGRSRARVPEVRPDWTLHVGPYALITTDADGRHEYAWTRVVNVSMGEFDSWGPYRLTLLFLAPLGPRLAPPLPAGWPYDSMPPQLFDHNLAPPVCVLGPMTNAQRDELSDALRRYAGWRWKPVEWFMRRRRR